MDVASSGAACPRCGGGTVAGYAHPGDGQGWNGFRPRLRRGWRYWWVHFNAPTGVPARGDFRACTACGLVYGEVDPAALLAFMAKEGYEPPPGESAPHRPSAGVADAEPSSVPPPADT